jgi:hypothetical protein
MSKNKKLKSFLLGMLAGAGITVVVFCLTNPNTSSDKLPKLPSGQTPFEDGAVINFFNELNLGYYDTAIPEYAGPYDLFHSWYPKVSLNDEYTIWKLVCERKDVYCLPIYDIVSKRLTAKGEIFSETSSEFIGYDDIYEYKVRYQNPDGSVFEMEPWSWMPEGEKISEFQVFVGRKGRNFFVLTPPPIHN